MNEPTSLNDAQDAYRRDGVCRVRGWISHEDLTRLEDGVEEALRRPGPFAERYGPEGEERFFGDINTWTRIGAIRDFVLNTPLAEIAGRIMGAISSTFFYDQLLVKEAGAQGRTPWHQDQPYWSVSGRQVCSIWMPLDPVGKEVSLEFVRGSHDWGAAFNPTKFKTGEAYAGTGLDSLPDIEADRGTFDIVSFEAEPGDCIVFNAMLVHGAPANPTARRRRVLATRWLGDDARYCDRPGEVGFPTEPVGLVHGDRYCGRLFPEVWRAG